MGVARVNDRTCSCVLADGRQVADGLPWTAATERSATSAAPVVVIQPPPGAKGHDHCRLDN